MSQFYQNAFKYVTSFLKEPRDLLIQVSDKAPKIYSIYPFRCKLDARAVCLFDLFVEMSMRKNE